MKRLKIPLGVQKFWKIRSKDSYYVDKTEYVARLLSDVSDSFFLSRPRRFGKTMLIDTFYCLFEGKKSLFEGLYIYDKWDWSEKFPIIRLSFNIGDQSSPNKINTSVIDQLVNIARRYELSLEEIIIRVDDQKNSDEKDSDSDSDEDKNRAANILARLIYALRRKTQKQVVVLIDEYDKPMLDVLSDKEATKKNRNELRTIYTTLKGMDDELRFLFITGISLFSKMDLLSGINHLRDISLELKYTAICGYTEAELIEVFAAEMDKFELADIRRWYDGYCWDRGGKGDRVFCPHSVLKLFIAGRFGNWWYEECVPKYLYDVLCQRGITSLDVTDRWVNGTSLGRFDVEKKNLDSMLFQSGYLTIREVKTYPNKQTYYLLGYPNLEVQQSMSHELLSQMIDTELPPEVVNHGPGILDALASLDMPKFHEGLDAVFAKMPSQWHKRQKQPRQEKSEPVALSRYESWYASVIFAALSGLDCDLRAEESTRFGRSDMALVLRGQAYVLEIKCVDSADHSDKGVVDALSQITKRGYGEYYRGLGLPCHMVAVVCGREERGLVKVATEQRYEPRCPPRI